MRPKRSNFAIPVLVILAGWWIGTGCSSSAQENESRAVEARENVRIVEIQLTDLDETLVLTGRLRAERATDLSTEEQGVVAAVDVDKGSRVGGGEVILRLDRRMLKARLESAEAVATLRRYNEERTRTLFEENQVSKQEMLRVHTELEQAKANVETARLHYERAAIEAPFDAIVSDRYVELGELVQPGQRVVRVVDPYVLELEAYATGVQIAYLQEGAPAQLSVDGVTETLLGQVSYVSVEADPSTGKFPVEIELPNPDLVVRAGLVARARVLKRTHRLVVAIPRDAVLEGERGHEVFVVEGDSARIQPVVLGPDQGLMVVIESGLEPGDRLVVRGQRMLSDGSLVEVTEVSPHRDGSLEGDPASVREDEGFSGDETAGRDLSATEAGRR